MMTLQDHERNRQYSQYSANHSVQNRLCEPTLVAKGSLKAESDNLVFIN